MLQVTTLTTSIASLENELKANPANKQYLEKQLAGEKKILELVREASELNERKNTLAKESEAKHKAEIDRIDRRLSSIDSIIATISKCFTLEPSQIVWQDQRKLLLVITDVMIQENLPRIWAVPYWSLVIEDKPTKCWYHPLSVLSVEEEGNLPIGKELEDLSIESQIALCQLRYNKAISLGDAKEQEEEKLLAIYLGAKLGYRLNFHKENSLTYFRLDDLVFEVDCWVSPIENLIASLKALDTPKQPQYFGVIEQIELLDDDVQYEISWWDGTGGNYKQTDLFILDDERCQDLWEVRQPKGQGKGQAQQGKQKQTALKVINRRTMTEAEAKACIGQVRQWMEGIEKEQELFTQRVQEESKTYRERMLEFEERQGWIALNYSNLTECYKHEFPQCRTHLSRITFAGRVERFLEVPIGTYKESHLRPLRKLIDSKAEVAKAMEDESIKQKVILAVKKAQDLANEEDGTLKASHIKTEVNKLLGIKPVDYTLKLKYEIGERIEKLLDIFDGTKEQLVEFLIDLAETHLSTSPGDNEYEQTNNEVNEDDFYQAI